MDGAFALLGDHSRQGVEKVDPRFLGTHARLCKSIQLVDISKTLSAGTLQNTSISWTTRTAGRIAEVLLYPLRSLSRISSAALLPVWRIVPDNIRFAVYSLLRNLGVIVYGQEHPTVQRLPFGLYLK